MIDRTGQVWRKTQSRASDIVVVTSTQEARKLGLKTGITHVNGTTHLIVRFLHKTNRFEIETWYESDTDTWEKKAFFTRTA
jgi:hypothetical protein